MHDQAATLRTMAFASDAADRGKTFVANTHPCRCVVVTGGKGGVGSSNLTVNLSLELGLQGNKVGLLDADHTLANADLIENVKLIPGGGAAVPHIFDTIRKMDETLDFMMIDTAAGIAGNYSDIMASASEVIVVVSPDPTSIVDAYATIKTILRRGPGKPVSVVVNDIVGIGETEHVYRRMSTVVNEFLDQRLSFLGAIPHDPQVQEAMRKQVPVIKYSPNSPASRAIRLIAKRLQDHGYAEPGYSAVRSFRDQLVEN